MVRVFWFHIKQKLHYKIIDYLSFFREVSKDLFFFLKYKNYFAYRPFVIEKEPKDIGILINNGLGDLIYALPALKQLSILQKNNNKHFYAVVNVGQTKYNNPSNLELLSLLDIFDSIYTVHFSTKGRYWKYPNLNLFKKFSFKLYPLIFNSNGLVKHRVIEVCKQFSVLKSTRFPRLCFKIQNSPHIFFNRDFFKGKTLLVHMESKSLNYAYPKLPGLINKLIEIKSISTIVVFSSSLSNGKSNDNRIIYLNPTNISLSNQLYFIKNKVDYIFAVNSYLWPIGMMFKKKLLGVKINTVNDANQFLYQNLSIITGSPNIFKKINKKGYLAVNDNEFILNKNHKNIFEYSVSFLFNSFSDFIN